MAFQPVDPIGKFTSSLRSMEELNLKQRQVDMRENEGLIRMVTSVAKLDPQGAVKMWNKSRLGREFGSIEFSGVVKGLKTFSGFDPETGRKQTFSLDEGGTVTPLAGVEASTEPKLKVSQKTRDRLTAKNIEVTEETVRTEVKEVAREEQERQISLGNDDGRRKFDSLVKMLDEGGDSEEFAIEIIKGNTFTQHAFQPRTKRRLALGKGRKGLIDVPAGAKLDRGRLLEGLQRQAVRARGVRRGKIREDVPEVAPEVAPEEPSEEDLGPIRVRVKATGETGMLPEDEFDPNIYERI